ncbi:MAG: TonB-dependent receptor [Acidobacteriota bacterium]
MSLERISTVLRVLILAAICSPCVPAQESILYASVSIRVTDPSGATIQGAVITARQSGTNLTTSGETTSDGRFRFSYLRAGQYDFRVRQPGFADAARTLTLTAGSAFELPISLTIAAAGESVTVSAETALLETARTQVAGTLQQIEIAALPMNGRNFLDLALLLPGVSPTNTGSNQLFAETSAAPGQGISVGSQRNFSNSFLVDGLSANDDAAGLSGMLFGLDAISELQVVTSGGQAELGRALAGYVSVVTKSGSNILHGDLYGYFRNQRLNAANPLLNRKLPVTQAQYGASIGGPLKLDRSFYFSNFEHRQLNQSGLITIAPANVEAINIRLAAIGYKGPPVSTGIYPNPVDNTNFLAKVDHQFSGNDQFSLRYSLYDVHSANSRGVGALSAASASAGLDNTDQTVAFGNIATLSPRTVNETRGQFTYSNLEALPTDLNGPAVSIAGIATLGTLSGSPTGRRNKLFEVVDNLSHQQRAHTLKIGAGFLYNDSQITYPRSFRGSYSFSSLANFLSGAYNNLGFTQTFGNSAVSQTNPNIGVYAQDEWKVTPALVLNVGIRYDLQFLKTISTDRNNISPRAGFAWSPFASRRLVVRGSYGLFYDRVPLRAVANAILSANNTTDLSRLNQINVTLSPQQAGAPVFPNILSGIVPSTLVNFTTMHPNMQNAYAQQGSFEIERQIGPRGTLSVGFQHLRGLHLIVSVNQNVPTCVAAGNNNACRPNPNYANNSQYSSLADSHYDGLHISFLQRPVKWGNYRISYAYSKSLNNAGEFFFSSPIDPSNIWRDYGRSDDDQRHRLTFDGVIHFRGFELSGMLQYYSAQPFNITSGSNTVQGTAARPTINGVFINRNAGSGNDFFNLNARVSRAFQVSDRVRLELLAEGFNALNHRNNLTRNGNFGPGSYPGNPSAAFGQITAVNEPRSVQLALRLKF